MLSLAELTILLRNNAVLLMDAYNRSNGADISRLLVHRAVIKDTMLEVYQTAPEVVRKAA